MLSKGKPVTLILAGLLAVMFGWSALAQSPLDPNAPGQHDGRRGDGRGPEGRPRGPFPPDVGFGFVGPEMRFGGKIVKGAPYSAKATSEFVQTLADGTRITRQNTATIYRDGEGRTRREQTLTAIGPFAASGEGKQMVFIHDPVAGADYFLDPQEKSASKMVRRDGPPTDHQPPPAPPQSKSESLGKQTIEGVECEGTRMTFTIPAGQFGNDRPIDVVSERWYSPELQVVVLSKHRDPRMGEHTYRLTNISRSEPAHALFEVPADYTIKERTGPQGGGRRGGRRDHRPKND